MICPKCATNNKLDSNYCASCGFSLKEIAFSSSNSNGNDSTIIWETRIGLLTNPVVLKQTAMTIAIAGLFMGLLLSFLMAATGEYHDIVPMLRVSLIVTLALGAVVALIMLIFLGNRIRVRFTVNELGVFWETIDKRILTANRMAIFAGAIGRSPTTAGAGAIAKSREKEFVSWNDISSVDTNPRLFQIVLKDSWRSIMLVICKPENFELVAAYITKRVSCDKTTDELPRKILAKPLVRAILRTIAVTVASFPIVAISEPLDQDIFLPILLFCFALATVWLIPFFGWVVLVSSALLIVQLAVKGYDEFYYLYSLEKAWFVLAILGLIFLLWYSYCAIKGKYLPPLLEN